MEGYYRGARGRRRRLLPHFNLNAKTNQSVICETHLRCVESPISVEHRYCIVRLVLGTWFVVLQGAA